MKCDMSIVVEGPDERGWFKRRCARECGKKTDWTPHQPERIHFNCIAWPRRWELGSWISLCLAVFGISKRRWSWVQAKLGLVEPQSTCGACAAREAWLNTFGGRLVTLAESKWYAKPLAWLMVTRPKESQSQ